MKNNNLVQNKATAARSQRLGSIGEQWAKMLLSRNGFTNIENLNNKRKNHAYSDIYAEKNGERYVISVKTRNKMRAVSQKRPIATLNDAYNLSSLGNHYALSKVAEEARQAKAAWIAIAVEATVFSAYFGLLADLNGKNDISMTERATSSYQCLAKDEPHGLDYSQIENIYDEQDNLVEDGVPVRQEVDEFTSAYPSVTAWVQSGALIEIGADYNVRSFIRALDEGGMMWEGEPQYPTMDAAFKALDAGIAAFLNEQGIKL